MTSGLALFAHCSVRQKLNVLSSDQLRRFMRAFDGSVSLFMKDPSQSYGASPAIWDHTALLANRHR